MAKVLVANHITLDGVMQSPARPDEDARDGFSHGGWAVAGQDELMTAKIGERMGNESAFLLGRRTYEDLYAVWGKQTGNPFSEALTNGTKYVASRSLREPLPWSNSILLEGDAAARVRVLKAQVSGSLTIFGSGGLIGSLMAADLIDEYLLMIHSIVLGQGRRLFAPGLRSRLRLLESVPTATGVVIALYEPARERISAITSDLASA